MRAAVRRCLGGAVLAGALAGVAVVSLPGAPLAAPRLQPADSVRELAPVVRPQPASARIAAVVQRGDAVVLELADHTGTRLVVSPDARVDAGWWALRSAADAGRDPLVALTYDAAGLVSSVSAG